MNYCRMKCVDQVLLRHGTMKNYSKPRTYMPGNSITSPQSGKANVWQRMTVEWFFGRKYASEKYLFVNS